MQEELEEPRHSSHLPYSADHFKFCAMEEQYFINMLQITRNLYCLLVHNRHKFILGFRRLSVGIISTHSLQMSESYPPDPRKCQTTPMGRNTI